MTFTISILIKSTIILLITTALVLALKKSSASLRHLVISLGLLGLLLLPVFQYFTPVIEVEIPIVEQLELETLPFVWEEEIVTNTIVESVEKESPNFIQQDVYVPIIEADLPMPKPQKGISFLQISMDWKEVLLGIWLLGGGLFLMRIVVQILHIWNIHWKSQPISIPLDDLGIELKRKVYFSSSSDIKTPMTFGLFQPKILLPTAAQNWSTAQLKIVLLHELAHIERQDYLLHLIGLFTLSLFWFHPLIWLLQKWQQSEREKACDEYVLKQGISKTNYAESLVSIARNMLSKKTHRWHSSLPMAASSETKKRVLAILKFDLQNWQFTRWMQWRWTGFFACVLPLLAAIHPATKEIIEESIPKIEAVLEQSVFMQKPDSEMVIVSKEVVEKGFVIEKENNKGVERIARLPMVAIQAVSSQKASFNSKKYTVTQQKWNDTVNHNYSKKRLEQKQAADTLSGKNLYGKWQVEDKEIEVWTKGEYHLSKQFPYFENLTPKTFIRIKVYEKSTGKKHLFLVEKTAKNGLLLDSYKGKIQTPIPAETAVYSYIENDVVELSFPCLDYGGCIISEKKKNQEKVKQMKVDLMLKEVAETIKNYQNNDLIEKVDAEDERWKTVMNFYSNSLSPKYNLLQFSTKEEWEEYLKKYSFQQVAYNKKDKKKKGQFESLNLPNDYAYIPSGHLLQNKDGEAEKVSIQGFHMSEIEITNYKYREFLVAMERRGKTDVLERARIHNESWTREYYYGEAMHSYADLYHVHPAFDEYPIVNISYEGAQAYCNWMTELYNEVHKNSGWQVEFRLPNKEEWMYAARGGHDLAYYPWGGYYVRNAKGCYLGNFKQIDESKLIFDSKSNTFSMADSLVTMAETSINGEYKYIDGQFLVIADAYFPNNYGLYNMSGNAAEMLQEKGTTKGGSWNSTGYHVRIDAEDEYAGWEEPNPYIGFRPIMVVRKK